jgi:hypothetical protein
MVALLDDRTKRLGRLERKDIADLLKKIPQFSHTLALPAPITSCPNTLISDLDGSTSLSRYISLSLTLLWSLPFLTALRCVLIQSCDGRVDKSLDGDWLTLRAALRLPVGSSSAFRFRDCASSMLEVFE